MFQAPPAHGLLSPQPPSRKEQTRSPARPVATACARSLSTARFTIRGCEPMLPCSPPPAPPAASSSACMATREPLPVYREALSRLAHAEGILPVVSQIAPSPEPTGSCSPYR